MLPAAMTTHDATSGAGGITATRPSVLLEAGAVRVVFTWQGDRWSHHLEPAAGGAAAGSDASGESSWRSLDGAWPAAGDPRWPASPVLVELSQVDRPHVGPAILAVGMAGRSHYSASVIRDPTLIDAVRFEIACRIHDGPGWLGSTYRQGSRLLRIEAAVPAAPLPLTVEWSYSLGAAGIFGIRGATLSTQ